MAYITNITQLKEYILRQLGSESHIVEISDINWNDIYNSSLKYLMEYFDEAVNEKTVLLELNNIQDMVLNEKIMGVKDIRTTANDLGLYLAYPGVSPIFDFVSDGDRTSVSSYLATMSYIRQIDETFRKQVFFRFNAETHRLTIGESIASCLLLVFEAEDPISLYNSRYFHKILEANAWKTWAVNTGGKYNGMTIGNGLTINTDGMNQKYLDLMSEIKDAIDGDEFSFLGPIRLNSL